MYPDTLHNNLATGVLDVLWKDGERQQLSNGFLRSQCQCSICRSERLHKDAALLVTPEIRITAIQPVGAYGVQFVFSDGHQRGIFPWVFIRDLDEQIRLVSHVEIV
ncbi:MAG TPA: DUF971 domain-containing protein [Burkholderiales bacterium]|nr:DUF971 domain-containing protein [Burkholderiales bacterium]